MEINLYCRLEILFTIVLINFRPRAQCFTLSVRPINDAFLVERYAWTVFFYATNGKNWKDEDYFYEIINEDIIDDIYIRTF